MSEPYTVIPSSAKAQPVSLQVTVPEDRVTKLKELVRLSDLAPKTFESSHDDHKYGLPRSWLEGAKEEWEHRFDWWV